MVKKKSFAQKWNQFRKEWFKNNPPDFWDYYYCYICGKAMRQNETTLDHVISRSRRPDLRLDESNIRPCCWKCNTLKGSSTTIKSDIPKHF